MVGEIDTGGRDGHRAGWPTGAPMILGHRGASADAPENTIEAYCLALTLGADGVELDVRVSADGSLVLHHDAVLPDGGLIHELTRAALPPSMPTLAEALDALAGSHVNIEIKNLPIDPDFDPTFGVAAAVADLLEGRGWADDVLVSSFHVPTLERFKRAAPHIATGVLSWFGVDAAETIALAVAGGHQAVHPHVGSVTHGVIEAAHHRGLVVNTWTLDDPDHAAALADMGIDGIVTNVPDVLVARLRGGKDKGQ